MSGDDSGNHAMDESRDESGETIPVEDDKTAPVSSPHSVVSESYELIKLSPFEERVQKIFIGPEGLRPLWRLVLYVLLYRGFRFGLRLLIYYGLPDMGDLRLQGVAYGGLAIAAIAAALVMGRIEDRPFGSYGLPPGPAFGKLFWLGSLWGFGSITLLLLALRGASAFDFGLLALHGARALKFAVFWAVLFLIVGFHEEFLTRGYTQFTLTQVLGFWPSAGLLSVAFGLLHLENPGESWVGILGAILIGFFFCLTLRRTGNLWFAIGFHYSWDWGESYFYSVPDSGGMVPGHLLHSSLHGPSWLTGGTVGPEGSVFLFILLLLLWVAFDRVYPEVKYPPPETSPRTT
jgi:membrane protease YdiL (CAAX protease family)